MGAELNTWWMSNPSDLILSKNVINNLLWVNKGLTEDVLVSSDLLLLPSQIENKYWLLVAEQHIFEIENYSDKDDFTKKEFLLRNKKGTRIDKLLQSIEMNWDSFWLFCFMLKKAYEEDLTDPSINVSVNEILDNRFTQVIELYEKHYKKENSPQITLEILEDIRIPHEKASKKFFDKNKEYAINKWFKIAQDDLWAGFSDISRTKTLNENKTLDWIKLDIKLARTLYIYSLWNRTKEHYLRKTYGSIIWSWDNIIEVAKEYHSKLVNWKDNFTIVAEWIEDCVFEWVEIKKEGLIEFLKKDLGVTHLQGFDLHKPEIIKK